MKEKKYLILLSSTILIMAFVFQVSAQSPTVNVDPSYKEVDIGTTFTVTINITNVGDPGLYAYEIKVYYNATLLNATAVSYPTNHFLSGTATFTVPPVINNTGGYVYFGATILGEEPGRTGSGILATIEFKGIAVGVSLLEVKEVVLLDPDGEEISSSSNNGTVNIIPEFAQLLLILTFTTLAVIALKKFAKSKNLSPIVL